MDPVIQISSIIGPPLILALKTTKNIKYKNKIKMQIDATDKHSENPIKKQLDAIRKHENTKKI